MDEIRAVLSVVAVAVIGLFGFLVIGTDFATRSDVDTQQQSVWTDTDPSEFGTYDWIPSAGVTYATADPFEIISGSELVVKGSVKQVISDEIVTHDNSDKDAPIEPPLRIITYVVEIDKVIKGEYDSESIDVVTVIDTKIDYLKDDDVYFMLENVDGQWTPIAGPHAMFKIKDGFAIGDEKTLPIDEILKP